MSGVTSGLGNVLPAGAGGVSSEVPSTAEPWWLAAPAALRLIEERPFVSRLAGSYRFGDAVLELEADDAAPLKTLPDFYADCAVDEPRGPGLSRVRCRLRRSFDPPLVVLTFEEGAPPDAAAVAYNLLRPTQAVPPFRVWNSPLPGWRLAGGSTGPVLTASGKYVLLHPKLVSPEFLVEYLVGMTLGVQPGLLSIHGASLQVGDAGVVLIGASHSSKTTTSLHLAARGHPMLGDEVALIRIASTEIVPFRRTVNLRPGPRARELQAVLDSSVPGIEGSPWNDDEVVRHRIADLFPGRPARPVPLRAAFFLGGFAARPSTEPFQLTLDKADVFGWITTPEIAYSSWGLSPARRAFRLLVLKQLFSRIPCRLLTVGPPRETVELIEHTMEELAC